MATTKKPAKKATSTKKATGGTKRPQPSKAVSASAPYGAHIQLEVILFALLSIVFLIFAIVRYQ